MSHEGLITSFPWLKYASFSQNFTDQHFLYHLFLTPFVVVFPPLLGVKIASIILAMAVIIFFYCFLKRWGIRWPLFYTLILLSIPPFILRMNLAKAGPLAILILLVGLSLIWQKRYWALGILSFIYVWTHGGWVLMILLIGCSIISNLIIKLLPSKEKNIKYLILNITYLDWKLAVIAVGGILAGLIINPYLPHNLQFYWEQMIQIGLVNYQAILPVGREWYPFQPADLIAAITFPLILTMGALAAFFWRIQKETRTWGGGGEQNLRFQKILTLFLFAGLLGVMTLKSQRYIEYFAPFFVLANAFLLDFSLPYDFSPIQSLKKFVQNNLLNKIIIIFLITTWLIFFLGKGWELRRQLAGGFGWTYLQNASQWLKENTPDRGLVFHSGWSDFPVLFYHNNHNVYIAGMDPTFFYRFNPELYREWDKIIRGQEPAMAEKIKNDFGTNFILIKLAEKPLLEKVEKDPRFVLRYEDKEARIFEIK